MALIKCSECGQMVSTKAEKCPKCGYSVRLSMEQEQEKAKQPIEIHPTMETEKNEVVNNEPQFQQKSKKKGILIAVIVALIIGCGVSYALYINNNSSSNNQPQNKPFNGSSSSCGQPQDNFSEITEQFTDKVWKYEELGSFSEGFAAVQRNGLWGYIDKDGNEVIPCQYESAKGFVNSRAVVEKGDLYGCIDTKGREVIPFEYGWINHYTDYFTVNKDYKDVHGCGCIDNNGKEIAPCIYSAISPFSDGLSRVRKGDLYGYIDKQGKEVIPCKYEYADVFSDGLALIEKDGLYGFIDIRGNETIPCKYTYAHPFSEGMAAVQIADADGISKGGYIDSKGNEVIPCIYNTAIGMNPFSNGIAIVMDEQGFLGCINTKGEEVLVCVYGDIQVFDNIIAARESASQSYWLFDMTGKKISTSEYDAIYPAGKGQFIVIRNGKSGFINQDSKVVIPLMFDAQFSEDSDAGWIAECKPFVEGVSIVRQNGRYGAIDEQGNKIVPYIYDEIWDFSEGFAVARIGEKWGYIDMKGNSTFSQDEIAAASLRETKHNEEVENIEENVSLVDNQTKSIVQKSGFSSWEDVINFLPNKKFVSHDFYGYEYANELTFRGENGKLVMCINGVKIGEVGYDLRDKDKFNPNKIHMLLRVIETDYPMNGGVKRDYVFTIKTDKQRGVYLYFEPRLQENIFTHERFYEYYIPMFENGKLNMNFSSADTYEECKFFYYYAVDE